MVGREGVLESYFYLCFTGLFFFFFFLNSHLLIYFSPFFSHPTPLQNGDYIFMGIEEFLPTSPSRPFLKVYDIQQETWWEEVREREKERERKGKGRGEGERERGREGERERGRGKEGERKIMVN